METAVKSEPYHRPGPVAAPSDLEVWAAGQMTPAGAVWRKVQPDRSMKRPPRTQTVRFARDPAYEHAADPPDEAFEEADIAKSTRYGVDSCAIL